MDKIIRGESFKLKKEEGTIVHVLDKWVKKKSWRPALMEKRKGKWISITWKEFGERVENIACALQNMGLQKGDRVAIFADNRMDWTCTDLGILAAGGITVPIYASNSAVQVEYIVKHSEAKFIFVNTGEQAFKVIQRREKMPSLSKVIAYSEAVDNRLCDYHIDEFYALGGAEKKTYSYSLDKMVEKLSLDDISTLMYTSGTTGPPKACILGHDNIMFICQSTSQLIPLGKNDLSFCFLPLAHALERHGGQFISIYNGVPMAYARRAETVVEDMKDICPTFSIGVPRFFEKVYSQAQSAIRDYDPVRRQLFKWALKVGKEHAKYQCNGEWVPLRLRPRRKIADKLVYQKIKKRFGGRLRFMISGGAPIAKELVEFFTALDISLMEGYGLTECTVVASLNQLDRHCFGTVGLPIPGAEIKIEEDGEILIRHGGVFRGYYKDEEATREVLDTHGWLRTGDIGYVNEQDFLVISDRKKDLIITAGGKNIAPQVIENMLKHYPLISQAVVYGDNKPYLVALLTIDEEELNSQSEKLGIDLMEKKPLADNFVLNRIIRKYIDEVNEKLSRPEQIKKYYILGEDFSQEKGEITPTLKLRRNIIREKYDDQIKEMYQ